MKEEIKGFEKQDHEPDRHLLFIDKFLQYLSIKTPDPQEGERTVIYICAGVISSIYAMLRSTVTRLGTDVQVAKFDKDMNTFAAQAGERLTKALEVHIRVIKKNAEEEAKAKQKIIDPTRQVINTEKKIII